MAISLTWADWASLFWHFASLSLLSIGGAIATVPDMHRFLHDKQNWLTELQFSTSIALAQAAPGPNVLFVALLGWHVGLNAGGGVAAGWHAWPLGLAGVFTAMVAILLPSSLLTYSATRWVHRHQHVLWVRGFKQGLAPVVVALMLATGWLLSTPSRGQWGVEGVAWWLQQPWLGWAVSLAVAALVWKTRIHMLWMLGAGAALGALGWV